MALIPFLVTILFHISKALGSENVDGDVESCCPLSQISMSLVVTYDGSGTLYKMQGG